ncbi:MAG: hypothetical protein R3321_10900, partial [Nitrososphaeraceae archaeon]|nr:hypothetical protein [Nitrososphaeraceae archaeon]
MRNKIILLFILLCPSYIYAQYNSGGTQFYIGPRISLNGTKYTPGKNIPGVPEAYERKLGYGAGFMYKFKVTDFISLHGEFSFVRKTRSVVDSTTLIEFQNFHLDAPILFEINFPAKNEKIGEFEYFFNVGPQISYWLSGTANA